MDSYKLTYLLNGAEKSEIVKMNEGTSDIEVADYCMCYIYGRVYSRSVEFSDQDEVADSWCNDDVDNFIDSISNCVDYYIEEYNFDYENNRIIELISLKDLHVIPTI